MDGEEQLFNNKKQNKQKIRRKRRITEAEKTGEWNRMEGQEINSHIDL